jgi:hypothetical protein
MNQFISTALLALSLSLSFTAVADTAPKCTTGKPCGDTCIPKDKECHATAASAKKCTTGKPCGDTCIPKDKTCTK